MHMVFGISALAMLGTTIWMLVADYDREWKDYQRKFLYDVEPWVTQARLNAERDSQYEQQRALLQARLDEELTKVPPATLVATFEDEVRAIPQLSTFASPRGQNEFASAQELYNDLIAELPEIREDYETLQADPAAANRTALIQTLENPFIRQARFIENDLSGKLKFRRADLDVARSSYYIAIDESADAATLARLQGDIDRIKYEVDDLALLAEETKAYRQRLEAVLSAIRKDEVAAQKRLDEHDANVKRLARAYEQQTAVSKRVLEVFPLDAFNSPLKIDNIWLPKLTINMNFRDVARFDRCTTCHRGIDATAPGSATEPGFKPQEQLTIQLPTPKEPPAATINGATNNGATNNGATNNGAANRPDPAKAATADQLADQLYGLVLAKEGLIHANDATIEVVRPRSAAAKAQFVAGDVIAFINDVKITDRRTALLYLVESVKWGQPLQLKIKRGLPQPFSSHPRLDLFVGSLSPHKLGQVGCTICHDGQGSATAFKWASHTPDTVAEADRWKKEHGWFDNHHWIFPMLPNRFAEASCLKCHHEVVELEPSERFPDPPAPKLLEGYNLVRQYGCFGCHEINGYDGPHRRIGPDLRAEPNYAFAAKQILLDAGLSEREKTLAEQVVADPSNDTARRQLMQAIEFDARRAAASPNTASPNTASPNTASQNTASPNTTAASNTPASAAAQSSPQPHLSPESQKLAALLADQDTPGQFRKVGPSLRHIASKSDFEFLYNWVRKPADFRPTTRMPQFFELYDHLLPQPKRDARSGKLKMQGDQPVLEPSPGLHTAQRFEPIEIRAITEYLLAASQPFEYLEKPQGVTADPSAERGKELFEVRGCLACHMHKDFPAGKASHGPDLSRMGDKLANQQGPRWLYSWLREPSHYHARTLMPNALLLPIEHKDQQGEVTEVTDPAADIAAYLLGSRGWTPRPIPQFDEAESQALDDLALQHLAASFSRKQAQQYLQNGIPESQRSAIKGDESALVGKSTDENRIPKALQYVGRRAISKYGCAGCHDIPGFEGAKPIGTALADWGRKDPAKLAFEQISPFMVRTHGTGQLDSHDDAHTAPTSAEGSHDLKYRDMEPSHGYLLEKLMLHQREGFLWQKIRAPRSFDYMKTENKAYNDRLRMPRFPFDQQQIEAVMTFVLGLVAEPPAPQFVYSAPPRERAIVEGNKLLDKFNCAGCHALQMDRIEFDYDPHYGQYASEKKFPENEYDIFRPHFTDKQAKESQQVDRRGLAHSTIVAQPVTDEQGMILEQEDDDDPNLMVRFYMLWNNELINGQPWLASDQLPIPTPWVTLARPPQGGDFARLIHMPVLEAERGRNPNAKYTDAWGWVPPPLVGEGRKVQTDWLHDFLLDPYAIRPAAVLRMPKFNMSPAEAGKLANYFAAVDRADYPYDFDSRMRESHLSEAENRFPGRLDDALRIVTNGNYCIKCHLIGDFLPPGSEKALAPRLDRVHNRLRPDFLQAWLANPKRLLPYTGMPVNFPLDKPLDPKVFPGDKGKLITEGKSEDQLEAVVDLLLNYDQYMKEQTSIKPLIQAPPAAPTTGAQE